MKIDYYMISWLVISKDLKKLIMSIMNNLNE